jgi:hypothetical protein
MADGLNRNLCGLGQLLTGQAFPDSQHPDIIAQFSVRNVAMPFNHLY